MELPARLGRSTAPPPPRPMHVILILSAKGGAGKTTLARELAASGVQAGRQVALVDLDPQLGLTGWYGRRSQEAPHLVAMPPDEDLNGMAAVFDEVVIDLPPGLPPVASRLAAKADLVLIPVRASPDDLVAVSAALRVLRGHPRWAF